MSSLPAMEKLNRGDSAEEADEVGHHDHVPFEVEGNHDSQRIRFGVARHSKDRTWLPGQKPSRSKAA